MSIRRPRMLTSPPPGNYAHREIMLRTISISWKSDPMPILRLSFCLLLLTGFSRYSLAQIAEDESPSGPIQFGMVEVKDGDFTVTEFVPKTETVANQYFVPDEAISFFTTTGKRVTDIEAVRNMLLKGSRPAAIKHDPSPIGQIDQKDVKPNLIVVQIDCQCMDVSRYLQRGQNLYYRDKEYAKAIAEFELATKVSPQYSESWRLQADALATCPVETIRDEKPLLRPRKRA